MTRDKEKNNASLRWIIIGTIIIFSAAILYQRTNVFTSSSTVSDGPEIVLTSANFEHHTAKGVILVDVWAEWCKPCKAMEPTLESLAEEMTGKASIGKLNADENRKLASELGVQVLPTFILFKDGKEVERFMGMKTKESLKQAIDKALDVNAS